MVQIATASLGSVCVHQDTWETTAPLPAWQEPMAPIAHQFVIAKMMVRVPPWTVCAFAKKGGKEWIALFHVQVEVGVLTVTRRVTAQMEQPAGLLMASVCAPLAGRGTTVTSRALMEHMVLIAVSAVTVTTQMGAIPSPVTAAALLAGQASTVTICAPRAAGDRTAPSPVAVRTGDPVLRRTAPVTVHLATEDPCAKEFAPLASMDTTAASHALSACTAAVPVTTCPGTATACQDSSARSATKCVPVENMGRTVLSSANAPRTGRAIPSMGRASAFQAG